MLLYSYTKLFQFSNHPSELCNSRVKPSIDCFHLDGFESDRGLMNTLLLKNYGLTYFLQMHYFAGTETGCL